MTCASGRSGHRAEVLKDAEAVAMRAAELVRAECTKAIDARGVFYLAVSGGRTPRRLFEILASDAFISTIPWDRVRVYFVDERCVPPDHADSNYRMASEALLSKVNAHVHRVHGELSPEAAADAYRAELEAVPREGGLPVFDLLLLGMGDDGHTASLFPGSASLGESMLHAVADPAAKPPRVTITLPVINAAREIVFVVTGRGKQAPLGDVLFGGNCAGYPAGRVRPCLWLVDEEAAGSAGK